MSEVLDGYNDDEFDDHDDSSEITRESVFEMYRASLEILGLSEEELHLADITERASLSESIEAWLQRPQLAALHALVDKLFPDEERNRQTLEQIRQQSDRFLLTTEELEQVRLEAISNPDSFPENYDSIVGLMGNSYADIFMERLIAASQPVGVPGTSVGSIGFVVPPSEEELALYKLMLPSLVPFDFHDLFAVWVGPILSEIHGIDIDMTKKNFNHMVVVPPPDWNNQAEESNLELTNMMLDIPAVFKIFLAQEIAIEQMKMASAMNIDIWKHHHKLIRPIHNEAEQIDQDVLNTFFELVEQEVAQMGAVELCFYDNSVNQAMEESEEEDFDDYDEMSDDYDYDEEEEFEEGEEGEDFSFSEQEMAEGALVAPHYLISYSFFQTEDPEIIQLNVDRYYQQDNSLRQLRGRLSDQNSFRDQFLLHHQTEGVQIETVSGKFFSEADLLRCADIELNAFRELADLLTQAGMGNHQEADSYAVSKFFLKRAEVSVDNLYQSRNLQQFLIGLHCNYLPVGDLIDLLEKPDVIVNYPPHPDERLRRKQKIVPVLPMALVPYGLEPLRN